LLNLFPERASSSFKLSMSDAVLFPPPTAAALEKHNAIEVVPSKGRKKPKRTAAALRLVAAAATVAMLQFVTDQRKLSSFWSDDAFKFSASVTDSTRATSSRNASAATYVRTTSRTNVTDSEPGKGDSKITKPVSQSSLSPETVSEDELPRGEPHKNSITGALQQPNASKIVEAARVVGGEATTVSMDETAIAISDDTTAGSDFKKGYDIEAGDPRPRNLHLAFIGDSVTRYQYVSLVYFLKTGQWWNQDEHPTLLYRVDFASWNEYFLWSNKQLQPEEQCDCARPGGGGYYNINENRYFFDPVRNNSVSINIKFGKATTHGHMTAPIDPNATIDVSRQPPYAWENYGWNQTITEHIAKLVPKPDFLVFNAGLHANRLTNPETQQSILDALAATNIIGIYKTTTRSMNLDRKKGFSRGRHDKSLCGKVFPDCMDLGWVGDLIGPDYYHDDVHLKSAGNTLMNLQLLAYLREYHGGVTAIDFVDAEQLRLDPVAYWESTIASTTQ